MNLTFKPKNTKIDLSEMKADQLEYYCTTKNIDRLVCKGLNVSFNEELAEAMEKDVRMYFVVKTNREYDVKSGILFEAWLFHNGYLKAEGDPVPEYDQSSKAGACKEHFVMQLIAEHGKRKK